MASPSRRRWPIVAVLVAVVVVAGAVGLVGLDRLGGGSVRLGTRRAVDQARSKADAAGDRLPTNAQPPYVATATWGDRDGGRSLMVVPTRAGRTAIGNDHQAEAWAEVLKLAPDGDTPGMKAQFDCHWQYARIADPDKASWNLEPWRPVVTETQMVASLCNPVGSS